MPDFSKMNEAQRLAVTHGEGPLLLLAGPGSGKTFTITQRILYLLEQGVPPEQLLVITFTRDAAASMQQRFRRLTTSNLPVNFGTFHSVFYHIVTESDQNGSNRLLNLSQKKKILLPILKEFSANAPEKNSLEVLREDAASILSAMSFYKNTLQLEQAKEKAPGEWQAYFEQILERYERVRREQRALDFDDMVCECRKLLAENQVKRQYWQNRFTHILMDEFQDINPIQYETVKLLAKPPYNLFAVGDDDQAIYGFRGSQPECLKRFAEEFRARRLLLDINYRSCGEIIAASGRVIAENRNRFSKTIRSSPGKASVDAREPAVILKGFETKESQYEYLIQRLKTLSEAKTEGGTDDSSSHAVLFRTNALMQGVAVRLRRAGISYTMKERVQSIYDHFIIRDLMAYLTLAEGRWSREAFLRIMNRPSRYISRESLGGCSSLAELRKYYETSGKHGTQTDALQLLERQLTYLKGLSPGLAVAYICKAMGYEQFLRESSKGHPENWSEWQELLDWVKADAGRFKSTEEWQAEQEAYTKALEQGAKTMGSLKKEGAVQLMTVHASKGLEFDRVFIPDCNERVFPHGRMPAQEVCEEERRIFYVAMTRAAKSLELLYLTGTDHASSRLPSRFLNPLLKTYSSTNSSNSQLSRYSSKASATFSYSESSSM